MRQFHTATIIERLDETADSVCLTLSVPAEVAEEFRYAQGQHLPIRCEVNGQLERRTYSICASVAENKLRIGVRVQPDGVVSNYLAQLNTGDTLEIMPPYGHFYTPLDPLLGKRYAAFVAGSGITPLLSIIKTTLETEPNSSFVVFYGNRRRNTTMFIEELWALKNTYGERLALHFIMSQEPNEIALYAGRIDGAKATSLHQAFLSSRIPDETFICGPNPMIDEIKASLLALGYSSDHIHSERFRAGLAGEPAPRSDNTETPADGTDVTVIIDGQRQRFQMLPSDASVLDAAEANGIDLPYSCKGGVCSTCRTLLRSGEVDMPLNYALEDWELDRGFILTCQARPRTAAIEIDYDET